MVHPVENHAAMLRSILDDQGLSHVLFDLSWSEAAKYLVASAATTELAAGLIGRYPDRFLFGTDALAPPDRKTYLQVFEQYAPLWERLDARAGEKVRRLNYQRVYDEARRRVRAWERSNVRLAAAVTPGR